MKLVSLDIETTGLNPRTDKIHGVGVATSPETVDYYDLRSPDDAGYITQLLTDPEQHIVGHNLRFDLKFLMVAGFEIKAQIWDTKILAQLINENRELGLKPLTAALFGSEQLSNKSELDSRLGKLKMRSVGDLCAADLTDPTKPHHDLIARYCKEDCVNTLRLWLSLVESLKTLDQRMREYGFNQTVKDYFVDEAMPLEMVLIKMELSGIGVNESGLRAYRAQLHREITRDLTRLSELCRPEILAIEDGLYEKARAQKKSEKGRNAVQRSYGKHGTIFNWQSADHCRELFFERLSLPKEFLEKTRTGQLSINDASLEQLCKHIEPGTAAAEILEIYRRWKKTSKLFTTYTGETRGLLSKIVGGRIYAEYLQAGSSKENTRGGTVTGRLSSRNPNMQNLPRGSEIKRFFVPDPGHVFIYFDYSQLELRLAAHLSQDRLLIKAYNEGLDLHQITADSLGEDRQLGKTVNFAMIYDASPYRLAQILERSPEECKRIIHNFYSLYSGYSNYLRRERLRMCQEGVVVSVCGRVRRLPELRLSEAYSKEWNHALKQGYNFPIQSLGASITKRAMLELDKRGYKLVTQVHDSVVVQVEAADVRHATYIQQIAEQIYPLSVPLKAETKLLTSLSESDILSQGEKTNANE